MKPSLVILATFSIVITVGHADVSTTPSRSGQSIMNLQQEFERRTANLDVRGKRGPEERLKVVVQLLDELEETGRQREYARLTKQPTNTSFDDLLAQAFVERLLKSGEVKSLELLLAMNCPEYVAAMPLEFVLALSKQPDAILILPRAYSAGATNAAGKVLLRCLVRAFPALKQSAQSEKAFVRMCETWWATNRTRCALNLEYPHVPGRPVSIPGQHTAPEQCGLFILNK